MEGEQDKGGYGYSKRQCPTGTFLLIPSFICIYLKTLLSSKDKMAKHRLQFAMFV